MRGISRRARIITALFVGVCAYLAAAVTAHAVAYCMIPGLYLCNGCTANATWKVVVSSYPRHEIIPGVKNNRIWCRETRSSLGGHSRNKIVTAPKLGVLRANGYDIRYKGDRVGHEDLAGAISLNSAQMNASRVIGPAIGGVLYAAVGVAWVFGVNTATYLIVIGVLLTIRLPPVEQAPDEPKGLRRLLGGLVVARQDRTIRRVLLTMAVFSLFSLPFVTQMPVIAERNLGIDADSAAFGLFYACLGFGAVVGSLSIGTVFAQHSKRRLVRQGLGLFAVSLAALALVRAPLPAYPITVVLGGAYFGTVTALSTVLQEQLDDRVRGRVLALWIMCFGGTVPIGGLIAGPLIEKTSVTVVMLFGAFMAALLGLYAYLYTSEPTGRRARRATSGVDEALS